MFSYVVQCVDCKNCPRLNARTGRLRVAEEGDLAAVRRAGDDVKVVRRGAQKDVPDALVGHPRARSIVRDLPSLAAAKSNVFRSNTHTQYVST